MKLKSVRRGTWQVLAACTGRGECPLLDFLAGLEGDLAPDGRRMLRLFERVATAGPPRNTEISHQIEGEIWELIQGRLRVLWFYDQGRMVVCSHGFVKSSPKTPRGELVRARETLWNYQSAKRRSAMEILP
ncbi:MAG: type II toxin-antitoxin system RelE/ParE family toxin [Thermoanaerobaculia bacterium]|nr:type II toxin-antitoxin system RelE/ParE family toxin [Thermoanaerobaculia bacterium]